MTKKPLSIKQLLLIGFMFTAVLPLLVVMLLAFYQARDALRTEITNNMQTRANAAFAEVDNMMFERLQNATSWSRLEIMQEVVIGDVDKRLSQFLSNLKKNYRGIYHALYVVNASQKVIAASDAGLIGKTVLTEKASLSVQFAGQKVTIFAVKNKALPLSVQIQDANNQPVATLWLMMNWQAITDILNRTQNNGSAAALFGVQASSASILANTSKLKQLPILATTQHWQTILNAHDVIVLSQPNQLKSQPLFNWQVAITQYRAVAMAPVERMGVIFAALLLSTIVLAVLLATPFARRITAPLAKLTAYAQQFVRTAQTALPAADGPAEVQDMSAAFSKMMADLALSKDNLTRAAKLAVAGEMAAAMSHEVRTPLGILRSSAQVLSREKNLSAEGLEVTHFITSETERLNKLVNTLVDSARPRAPEFASHDAWGLVTHAVAMLRMQAHKKGISIVLVGNSATPLSLICDAEQITQVLLNLILNAIQVLPEATIESSTTQTSGQIELAVIEEGSGDDARVIISVADNGFGVDELQKAHIFDPFFTQRPGGIGLGLAVSQQIVMAHGGKLTVDKSHLPSLSHLPSQGGADLLKQTMGAVFKVSLPKYH